MQSQITQRRFYGMFVDVEASGPDVRFNFITEFAIVIKDMDNGEIVSTFSTFIPNDLRGKTWDGDYLSGFWLKRPLLFKRAIDGMQMISSSGMTIAGVMCDFWNWIDTISYGNDITIFTDNPIFDIGWLNFYAPVGRDLSRLCGFYKAPVDTRSYFVGLGKKNIMRSGMHGSYVTAGCALGFKDEKGGFRLDVKETIRHSHIPLEDATQLSTTVYCYLKRLDELSKDVDNTKSD